MRSPRLLLPAILGIVPAVAPLSPAAGEERSAFFGDLHVHTAYSFDAFSFATRTTPDDAYRFAAGEAIRHPSGNEMQLDRPLDFYAVTDHAAYLGVLRALADPGHPLADEPEVSATSTRRRSRRAEAICRAPRSSWPGTMIRNYSGLRGRKWSPPRNATTGRAP